MEEAYFIDTMDDFDKIPINIKRIYYGEEMCENNFPTFDSIKLINKECMQRNIKFTLVTGIISQEKIKLIKYIFAKEKELCMLDEVVVNDFGILHLCLSDPLFRLNIIVGRLLNKASKTPRYDNIKNSLNNSQKDYYSHTLFDNRFSYEWLKKNSLSNVEYESTLQGQSIIDSDINCMMVYPYNVISITRSCLYSGLDELPILKRGENKCQKECKKYRIILQHSTLLYDIYCLQNGYFYYNDNFETKFVFRIINNELKYKALSNKINI